MSSGPDPDFLASLPGPFEEPTDRWVRVELGGESVADSRRARLRVEYGPRALPTYFFPEADVRPGCLTNEREEDGRRVWDVRAGDRHVADGAWAYASLPAGLEGLAGHVTFVWHRMDAWYEEDEAVFVHARDPYKRVDVLASSRHVEIAVEGRIVADSRRPHLLFETSLPTRYYLPPEHVRMDLLEPSEFVSHCPYKGVARYWSIVVGDTRIEDVAWSYPEPIPENPKIADLIAFFNERVDVRVDGELQPRPRTPWS